MSSADDRRAIWVLAFVALLGAVVRVVGGATDSPGEVGISAANVSRPPLDSIAVQGVRLARPLGPGERIDLDRSPAREIARLPGIGPGLASRIVSFRDSSGPFGSLESFDRVPGIGPRILSDVRNKVTFSHRRTTIRQTQIEDRIRVNTATVEQLATLPGIGPSKARAIIEHIRRNGRFRSVDELTGVSGIGPATVNRLKSRVVIP